MGAGWEQDGGNSTKSVDMAECWGVVEQRKLFNMVTGKDKYVQG